MIRAMEWLLDHQLLREAPCRLQSHLRRVQCRHFKKKEKDKMSKRTACKPRPSTEAFNRGLQQAGACMQHQAAYSAAPAEQ